MFTPLIPGRSLTPDRVDAVRRLSLGTVAGNILAGAVITLACRTSLPLTPLLCWYGALLLICAVIAIDWWRNRKTAITSVKREATKLSAFAAALALPWSVFSVATLGMLPHTAEIVLVGALGAMASNGTIYRAPVPQAAAVYAAVMLLPICAKCLMIEYNLLAILVVCYMGFLFSITAVTARFWRERAEENARSAMLVANFPGGVIMCNAAGRVTVMNEACRTLLRLPATSAAQAEADLAAQLSTHLGAATADDEAARQAVNQLVCGVRQRTPLQTHIELNDGLVLAANGQPTADGGYIAVFKDITDGYRAAKRNAHLARHDPLTGLFNRTAFQEELQKACDRFVAQRKPFALLAVDLDRFKQVNDTLGHPVGDELLIAVAARLARALREADVVARLGGDEFVIILASETTEAETRLVAARLQRSLEEPYQLGPLTVCVGASVGCAIAGQYATTPKAIIAAADRALYEEKSRHRAAAAA